MSSSETEKTSPEIVFLSDDDDDDDDVIEVTETLVKVKCSNTNSNSDSDSDSDSDDEPVNYPPKFTCKLCETPKPIHDTFRVQGCHHFYCSTCIAKHVTAKIQQNITQVTCPFSGCDGVLEPDHCRDILSRKVYDRWGDAMCEAAILGCEKFNCPFGDCGEVLINDGGAVVRECECPYCWRLFCGKCKVPWHVGIDCSN